MTELARFPVGAGLQTMMATALSALQANLATTAAGPVGRAVMAPGGAVPADACCPETPDDLGGQAHVRLSRMYPTRVFPTPDASYSRMPLQLAVELELGVFRCVSGLDDMGQPPSADEVTADAVRALDDVAALQRTALEAFGRSPVVLGGTTALGPSGYCAGATQLVLVAFSPACPPGTSIGGT